MKWLMLAGVLVLSGCAAPTPNQPAPLPSAPPPPASISLNVSPGVGANANQAAISANVLDKIGLGVPNVTVTFTAGLGTFSKASMVTDAGGLAQTTLTAPSATTVTATAGSISATASVPIHADLNIGVSASAAVSNQPTAFSMIVTGSVTQPIKYHLDFGDGFFDEGTTGSAVHLYAKSGLYTLKASATDASGRTGQTTSSLTVSDPPPPPVPPAPAPTPTPTIGLTLECTPATHGTATSCHVAMTDLTGAPITSTITSTAWDWGDGDPTTVVITPAVAEHTYAVAGSFTVIAKATAPAGSPTSSMTIKIP